MYLRQKVYHKTTMYRSSVQYILGHRFEYCITYCGSWEVNCTLIHDVHSALKVWNGLVFYVQITLLLVWTHWDHSSSRVDLWGLSGENYCENVKVTGSISKKWGWYILPTPGFPPMHPRPTKLYTHTSLGLPPGLGVSQPHKPKLSSQSTWDPTPKIQSKGFME